MLKDIMDTNKSYSSLDIQNIHGIVEAIYNALDVYNRT